MLGRALFKVARSRIGGMIIGWSFARLSALMPLRRLRETRLVVAFWHPKPAYPVHVLIVPKRAIRTFAAIKPDDVPVLQDVISVAQQLVRELRLDQTGYRVIINGGTYQDVQQLHVHLVSEERA